MSVMLLILAAFLIPNRWKNCLFPGCVILAVYIIFCFFFKPQMESSAITQQGLYLGICLLSCAAFIYSREQSERKHFAAEQLLEFMAITDRLTGIYNRGRFEFVLNAWIKNMRHDPFCLLLFDIDDFKKVNDRFGHNAGDKVLIETTKVVTATIRDEDIFARWGGEEFVVLFGSINIDMATELAERVRKAVEANECGAAGKITITIGAAQYCREESVTEFVNRADAKMYEAKDAGKNKVFIDTQTVKPESTTADLSL
jgi:diguanylate cyclase (GGDEF)-like protein